MSSSNSIFSSVESEKRWVLEVDKNLLQQHIVDIDFDTPTCVFRVPKTLTEANPEAYAPRYLGLGPYHYARPELYQVLKRKLGAVREFLDQKGRLDDFQKVVDSLIDWEPVVRACYDHYIDLDIQTLARMLAVDGLYLMQFLENYSGHEESDQNKGRLVDGDVMMIENQIPMILLKKIAEVLFQLDPNGAGMHAMERVIFNQFLKFCRAHSPLKLQSRSAIPQEQHLLQFMYYLIVNYRGVEEKPPKKESPMTKDLISVVDVGRAIKFLETQGLPGAAPAAQVVSFMERIPWDKIQGLSDTKQNVSAKQTDMPSVSQMSEIAGIKFKPVNGGIRDIGFDDDQKIFYLPVINPKPTTEIILRNLVAYEAMQQEGYSSTLEFAHYVGFMCGIINSNKDVEILKIADIIETAMPDEEIVRIFSDMRKSLVYGIKKDTPDSNIELAIEAGRTQYDNTSTVKIKRVVAKYASGLWENLKVLFVVLIVGLLTLQAFCSTFGCSRWFWKNGRMLNYHSDE